MECDQHVGSVLSSLEREYDRRGLDTETGLKPKRGGLYGVVLRIELTSSISIRHRTPASVSGNVEDEDETEFDDVESRCFSY